MRKKPRPLGQLLVEKIRGCGLSLNELGRRSGVGVPDLSRFVAGKRTLKLPNVERLLDALDLSVCEGDCP